MSVRLSSLRERLGEGRLVGTFVKLPALESIEVVAAELDFAVVDLEHSQLDEGDALRLFRHARALAFPAVVRVPELDRGLVNRLLEAGPARRPPPPRPPLAEYLAAQDEPLLVVQLETATTDDPPEEILGAGVDVAFIGTTDLTVDLELDPQRVATRVDELVVAAERA